MTVEEALHSALEYEQRVHDAYAEAAQRVGPPEARRFFEVMVREEQGHIDYLEDRRRQWQATGVLAAGSPRSALTAEQWGRQVGDPLQGDAGGDARSDVVEHLYAALRLEEVVSDHYRTLVNAVEHPDAAQMFGRFLEIEDGHSALVRAEIDFQTGTGLFYGIQEFTLDG